MTSKTFKSVVSNREVRIWPSASGFAVALADDVSNEAMSTQIAPSDAPALALAILEAAGVEARHHSAYENGTPEAMERIAQALTDEIGITEAASAEAKEQAELEAEALELFNLWLAGFNYEGYSEWTGENAELKGVWLAVARKAREMRAEK